jgi:hypothetical protein
MFESGALWGVATILGPMLLLAAMVYGVLMYRKRGAASRNLTEQTTRQLYRDGAERERARES